MKEKWLKYMRSLLINTVLFFLVWILLDVLFNDEINIRETIVRSVLYALIFVPIMEYMKKKSNQS